MRPVLASKHCWRKSPGKSCMAVTLKMTIESKMIKKMSNKYGIEFRIVSTNVRNFFTAFIVRSGLRILIVRRLEKLMLLELGTAGFEYVCINEITEAVTIMKSSMFHGSLR